jgi:hypothetical protein
MIKFFGRLRQNLLSEGKTGKYFKYAIGEIVLVVLGILIALSINNWNTQKNNEQKEKDALTEMYQGLVSNNKQLMTLENEEKRIVKIIDSLFLEKSQRGTFSNDTLKVYLGKAFVANRPKFVTTAYDVLLSSGIGLIQNTEIRYSIAKYYGQDLPKVESDGNDVHQEWYDVILPIIRKEADYWMWDEILVPYSMDSVFENEELFAALKTFKVNHYDMALTVKRVILENEKLMNRIEPLIRK